MISEELRQAQKTKQDQTDQSKTHDFFLYFQGLLFFIFQLLILFMYGFFAQYSHTSATNYFLYMLTNFLAALGFGLMLCFFNYSLKQALIITLLVISINSQFSPLLQKFWENVFLSGFNENTSKIELSFEFTRISTFCSISLLVGLSSVIGQIGFLTCLGSIVWFNIGFFFNYYLSGLIVRDLEQTVRLFDDFNGSRIFMFASGFGAGLMIATYKYNTVMKVKDQSYLSQQNVLPLIIGIIVSISAFFFVISDISAPGFSIITIYFTMSASILMSLAMSCILDGAVCIRDLAMSIFAGAIQVSIIISLIKHPFVGICVGGFAGLITPLLMRFIDTRINKNHIRDSKGLFSVFLINGLLSTFLVSPIIIHSYNINEQPSSDWNEGHHMIFAAIALGISLIFGLVAGIISNCINERPLLQDQYFFGETYDKIETRVPKLKKKQVSRLQSVKESSSVDPTIDLKQPQNNRAQGLYSEIELF